jgi:hypothetical protein
MFLQIKALHNLHPSPNNQNDQIKEDEIGRASSRQGNKMNICIGFLWGNQKEREH